VNITVAISVILITIGCGNGCGIHQVEGYCHQTVDTPFQAMLFRITVQGVGHHDSPQVLFIFYKMIDLFRLHINVWKHPLEFFYPFC
ncbi:hypothetical protein WDU94_015188, partial [Cyamophila willieti]